MFYLCVMWKISLFIQYVRYVDNSTFVPFLPLKRFLLRCDEQCLNEDIYKFSANKCVEGFNRQCNMFLLTLTMPIHMIKMFSLINILRHFIVVRYFYFNYCMDDVYISWRIAMRKVWRVP